MTTNQVMIHSGRVTRARARRRRPPAAPPRAANIAPAVRSVGTAIGQHPKAPKRAKRATPTAARARPVRRSRPDQSGPALRLIRAYGITASARTTRPGRRTPATIGGK